MTNVGGTLQFPPTARVWANGQLLNTAVHPHTTGGMVKRYGYGYQTANPLGHYYTTIGLNGLNELIASGSLTEKQKDILTAVGHDLMSPLNAVDFTDLALVSFDGDSTLLHALVEDAAGSVPPPPDQGPRPMQYDEVRDLLLSLGDRRGFYEGQYREVADRLGRQHGNDAARMRAALVAEVGHEPYPTRWQIPQEAVELNDQYEALLEEAIGASEERRGEIAGELHAVLSKIRDLVEPPPGAPGDNVGPVVNAGPMMAALNLSREALDLYPEKGNIALDAALKVSTRQARALHDPTVRHAQHELGTQRVIH